VRSVRGSGAGCRPRLSYTGPVRSTQGNAVRRLLWLSVMAGALLQPGTPRTSDAGLASQPGELDEIVYGGDAQFEPYEFLDSKGKPAGLNVDLIRAVARQQGLTVLVHLDQWTRIREGMARGQIDVAAMYRTPQRAREVDFAIAHELVYHEMFVRRGSPGLESLADLSGKRVLVEAGTYSSEALKAMGGCTVVEEPSETDALQALVRGRGDVAVVTQAVGRPFGERSEALPQVVSTGPPLLLAEYAFVTTPGHRQLLEKLNAGVAAVKASGEYDRIFARWLNPDRSAARARMMGWALLAALLGALLVIGWSTSLRRQVAAQTRALRVEFEEKQQVQAALASAERELRNAQRLETVGRVAGGMAHDFNNVLSVILSYGEALRELLAAHRLDTADVDEILSASERGTRLTRQLLSFSRETPLTPVRLDLRTLVGEMRLMLQRLVGEHIRVEAAVPDRPVVIEAEVTLVEQVVLNLAANARDAMPEGGRLDLQVGVRALVGSARLPDGEYATLRVSDTGTGMDAETLAHAFEPFFTTKDVGRGTGLGLATVLAHVRRLRGDVTVESTVGCGSAFEVLLPLSPVSELGQASSGALPAPSPVPQRILLVEDEPALRRASAQALRGAGHEVVEAGDGQAALELGLTESFTVVVTDVVMPRRGGSSLVAELRRGRAELLVLYLSGYVQGGQPLDLDLPGTEFLAKPYTTRALLEAVHRLAASASGPALPAGAAPRDAAQALQPGREAR
jgi:signal transduction histidine kinase/ActR/RegA family two-component response regulator